MTEEPGMLQSMGSGRVSRDLATEQQQKECAGNGDLPLAIAIWSGCNLVTFSVACLTMAGQGLPAQEWRSW